MKTYEWCSKRSATVCLHECPFCAKINTFCCVEQLQNIHDADGRPYYDAVIHCHFCGATVHAMAVKYDDAVKAAIEKWQQRGGE